MVLAIYFDDSGTSPTNNIAVAAGRVARLANWIYFDHQWEKARKIQGDEFSCMHMAEFVNGAKRSEFEGWSLSKKLRIAKRLRSIIKKSAIKGFALGVVKKEYDEVVPEGLRFQGFENHYTYAIRRVLGMINDWREKERRTIQPIEYVFDWQDRKDPRRKEIESVFARAEGEPEAFRRYGIFRDGVHFKEKEHVTPLQAVDMFAWNTYQAVLNEIEGKSLNPIAKESFKDFYLHKHKTFLEGGYNKKTHLIDWVKSKGFAPRCGALPRT